MFAAAPSCCCRFTRNKATEKYRNVHSRYLSQFCLTAFSLCVCAGAAENLNKPIYSQIKFNFFFALVSSEIAEIEEGFCAVLSFLLS